MLQHGKVGIGGRWAEVAVEFYLDVCHRDKIFRIIGTDINCYVTVRQHSLRESYILCLNLILLLM
jgi:hypothetical protein